MALPNASATAAVHRPGRSTAPLPRGDPHGLSQQPNDTLHRSPLGAGDGTMADRQARRANRPEADRRTRPATSPLCCDTPSAWLHRGAGVLWTRSRDPAGHREPCVVYRRTHAPGSNARSTCHDQAKRRAQAASAMNKTDDTPRRTFQSTPTSRLTYSARPSRRSPARSLRPLLNSAVLPTSILFR
jgi:hypothetical protein